ncbi:MAG: KpsF/GutQ family sugar-phosphate isomerase [Chitinispirillaceae bacterium]|nr:KpsF/GutQ family sugar-phosphate isomerase [Chitinispirillaceae bacterium]
MSNTAFARRIVRKEIAALDRMMRGLGPSFDRAVELIGGTTGKVIATGLGKSGIVAGKVAATLSSTGTPALFLHPVEALHGDIGIVQKGDIGLLFSNSGETREVLDVLQAFKRAGLATIAVTGRVRSSLADHADAVLDASVTEEACPLGLAPTSSVIVALSLGDALTACLMQRRGFTENDYSRLHPSGALGKKLLLTVADVMHAGDDLPVVRKGTPMSQALVVLTAKAMGAVIVTGRGRTLAGIYTDGDLKRTIREHRNFLSLSVDDLMTANPIAVRKKALAVEALNLMENRPSQISVLPVVEDDNKVAGIVRLHDLVKAGL